jgi:uncharacterized protein (TIGR03435 family)
MIPLIVKVTVVLGLGLLAAWLSRGSRAATRHALLAAVFAVTLGLPVVSLIAPPIQVPLRIAARNGAALAPFLPIPDASASSGALVATAPETPGAARAWNLSLSDVLLAAWIAGAALFLLPVVVGLWQLRSLRRSALPWPHGQRVIERLAPSAGIRRHVEALLSGALSGPMTCGIVRPAILLPEDAEGWAPEELDRALVHELEHVRRADAISHCLARIACAVYWFHPLIWVAWRTMVLEAERACDDVVLEGSEATEYADQLVGLAKRLSATQKGPLLAMANRADLGARVEAVLDNRRPRGRARKFQVALACGAAAMLLAAISPLMVVAAPQALEFEVASIRQNKSEPEPPRAPGDGQGEVRPGGQFTMRNQPLRTLLGFAFYPGNQRFRNDFIVGAPAWVDSDRFDVVGKAPGDTPVRQCFFSTYCYPDKGLATMLRTFLTKEFKIVWHQELRPRDVYQLVVAKSGPKMQRAAGSGELNCKRIAGGTGDPDAKGLLGSEAGFLCKNLTMDYMADSLSEKAAGYIDRMVVNATGLTGAFDVRMVWTSAALVDQGEGGLTVFDALEKQLGLKLQAKKLPVPVTVIDHMEKLADDN